MNTHHLTGFVGILFLMLVTGCGGTEENSGEVLVRRLNSDLPAGWSASFGGEAPELAGEEPKARDILVWRSEAVPVRKGAGEAGPVRPYFRLEARPWLEPEDARRQLADYREVRRRHEALDRTVGHLARTADGEFLVRGWTEEGELAQYREAKAALPELSQPPPDYYFQDTAFVLHDTRRDILPEAREEQTSMNVAYGVITRHLDTY